MYFHEIETFRDEATVREITFHLFGTGIQVVLL